MSEGPSDLRSVDIIDREHLLPTAFVMDQRTLLDPQQHSLRGKPRKLWTYILDWVLVIGFIAAFILIDKVNGHQREFSLTDQSLMYTMAVKETIPPWLLVVCAVVAPITITLVWTLIVPPLGSYQRRRWRKGEITWSEKMWDANLSLLGVGLAIASTITVTNTFKNLVGRPRPDFLDRCQPLITATNPSVFTLSTSEICTRTTFLKDGYRSFPSGHSSISFAGLGFLTLFIAGRLNVLDTRGQVWKTVIALSPLVAAGVIAISRLMDNRHHPFDVIFGSLLGLLFAWMAYRQYFPPLALAEGGRPYSLAEFATEKGEEGRPAYQAAQPYATPATYTDQPDLELGSRPRQRRKDIPGADGWEGSERTSTVPLRDDGYKPGPSFDEPTEYRRQT